MVSSSPAWCFHVFVRSCAFVFAFRNLLRDLHWLGWWLCMQQSLMMPLSMIHTTDPHWSTLMHSCIDIFDFQVKKHLLCPVVNRCFKSMHQPFQPWMKPYDCLQLLRKAIDVKHSMHGYIHYTLPCMSYHVVSFCIIWLYQVCFSWPLLAATFTQFAVEGGFGVFWVVFSPATECLDWKGKIKMWGSFWDVFDHPRALNLPWKSNVCEHLCDQIYIDKWFQWFLFCH